MATGNGVTRRWSDTLFFAGAGAALIAWARALHGFGAFLAGFGGLLCLCVALIGPADGTCPLCGRLLHGLFALVRSNYERCPHCSGYFREGQPLAEDHVAAGATFSVPLDDHTRLPDLCCVCAGPAQRTEQVTFRSSGRVCPVSPIVRSLELTVTVPYCNRDEGGVEITSEDFAPALPLFSAIAANAPSQYRMVLKVRSHRFYRAALGA